MRRSIEAAVAALVLAVSLGGNAGPASAQDLIPAFRTIVTPNADLNGGDLSSIFDTSHDACERACLTNTRCEAYTFNTRNNSCFLKAGTDDYVAYEGAFSGRKVASDPALIARAATRRADLTNFLSDWDVTQAYELALGQGRAAPAGAFSTEEFLSAAAQEEANGNWVRAANLTAAALNREDRADLWLELARRSLAAADQDSSNSWWHRNRAQSAATNAYLRAGSAAEQHTALHDLARVLEASNRGRDAVQALRLAQKIQPRTDTGAYLDRMIALYGFRLSGNDVQADLARPRICANFTEDLLAAGVDYADYLRLPEAGLAVEADQRQICVTGISHGRNYSITFREGLPAADGQVLAKDVEVSFYVRDRNPGVRMAGRGYVLPLTAEAALPVETVNTEKLDLELFVMSDRNLLRSIQQYWFGGAVHYYDETDFAEQIGASIWKGTATVRQEVNTDVTSRLPLAEALKGKAPGIYVLKASVPGVDGDSSSAAWQWFVVSDLGVTSMSGVDGLHVFVRSLGTAAAKAGVEVQLLDRANGILGTAITDDQGHALFDPGLTRGTGGSAPAMIVLREGEADLSFLSLTDPEFDLSDRGVAGREAAPPIDVFLTTDRGAYRAGETVHLTALARDPRAEAVEGLPLTAILKRPDGVEYSRQLVEDIGAGGHVFALPIAGSAPRGLWTVTLHADAEAPALATKTFLVEDFLPERIDFTLTLPEGPLVLGEEAEPTTAELEARWLFGAPAAGMKIEGELVLRAAEGLKAWPGYVFGRHDQRFQTAWESIDAGETLEDGRAWIDLPQPYMETKPDRPLAYTLAVRVSEGSGRPVERRVTGEVAPLDAMIGVKPLFDGVAAEGTLAAFEVIGIGTDLAPEAMPVKWTLTRVETSYQWYQQWGDWNWEPVTIRTPIAEGEASLADAAARIEAPVTWGQYELRLERTDGPQAVTTTRFWAGWYAPADVSSTPDTLELSLDRPAYRSGETAELRIVPRAAGTALITVLSNRLVTMKSVEVTEGENVIPLEVTDDWGAGVYVTASVFRPMDVAAGRNPARAMGLAHAAIDPGKRALDTAIEMADEADPRGPMEIAVRVNGVQPGETAHVTIAAVDLGILNLTGFKSPDPKAHFFGQRRLGVGIRDLYGRLIDGLSGAEGQVRSGGDAASRAGLQSPPPTEELVSWFSGPLVVGADGLVRASFDLPSFNGTVRVMAVAWSKTGVGQAEKDVLVRDPVVVTASVPRFLSPGDESRLRMEITHATGPSGRMSLAVDAGGLGLGQVPGEITLAEKGRQIIEVPLTAGEAAGLEEISIRLTTPDGKELARVLKLPVQVNDPEVSSTTRLTLAKGQTFTLDQAVFTGLRPGTAKSVMAIGPIARLNAPGLLAALDRYPYGCTEQVTSRALPLIYFDEVAKVMDLPGAANIALRLDQAVTAVLANQNDEGGFGLWSASGGRDLWLDAYVTDFLSRARGQGYKVPDLAFRNALANLRNRVNSAPDFTSEANDGGTGLAYALMVLAREGAAAIGDLRYYVDVKGDDFATPLAQAQLGAALASYGDQTRADAMFRKAGGRIAALKPETEQFWRADYGTNYRDAAALLALSIEAGSNAVDREMLVNRVSSVPQYVSTQEATWALMATHALIDRPDASGLSIDGAVPDGPLVRVIEEGASAPVVVKNEGADTLLTLTTYGVPLVAPPASGNGYAISRHYYTLDGEPVALEEGVAVGDRLVVVVEVSPFARSDGRLLVADPLPGGFEIDNPNLLSGGDTAQLGWLAPSADATHSEFRQDRFVAALDWTSENSFQLSYIVRAVSPGSFHHPAASVEDMYRPDFRAQSDAGRVVIAAQ